MGGLVKLSWLFFTMIKSMQPHHVGCPTEDLQISRCHAPCDGKRWVCVRHIWFLLIK